MLMWHGWADGAISGTSSIGYCEGVEKLMGGRKQREDFFRLFLIPGSENTRGHGTVGMARLWKQQLQELLETTPRRAM